MCVWLSGADQNVVDRTTKNYYFAQVQDVKKHHCSKLLVVLNGRFFPFGGFVLVWLCDQQGYPILHFSSLQDFGSKHLFSSSKNLTQFLNVWLMYVRRGNNHPCNLIHSSFIDIGIWKLNLFRKSLGVIYKVSHYIYMHEIWSCIFSLLVESTNIFWLMKMHIFLTKYNKPSLT